MHDLITLRQFIKEEIMQSHLHVSKPYEIKLLDDEKYEKDSVYVPNDIKSAIEKWAKEMMLR